MFDLKSAASAAARRCAAILTAILERRAIVPLLYANDHMLRDIGLSRSDIVDSLSGSLLSSPCVVLDERRNGRRSARRSPRHDQISGGAELQAKDRRSLAA